MTAKSLLLHYHPPPELSNPVNMKTFQQSLSGVFQEAGFDSQPHYQEGSFGLLATFTSDKNGSASVTCFTDGAVVVNLCLWIKDKQNEDDQMNNITNLDQQLKELLACKKSKRLPFISHQVDMDCYLPTSDRRIVEYDFDKVTFEADSDYQNIKIMHSPQYGNVLILDDDVNLAESDLSYTKAITGNGREDYTNKEILILGGGDGGILHELLQGSPKFVTMVEIDQIVIDEAIKHLRGICHNSMDSLKGPQHEVIVADCVPVMRKFIEEGKQFDYVINDLTAIPITTESRGDAWDFMRLILDLSMKVMKQDGKYFTQGNGANMTSALEMYETQLKKLECSIEFKKEKICVPSYLEYWIFYEIWKTC
ncbi:spermine synthase-like [Anneissia japonica]|uniref:spermine synthase-like n=1 Tax=Anneissia japonica TaxID=1529436 RepID=UPI001425836D|nr:spermine synthase-like [Anneissia japonica]